MKKNNKKGFTLAELLIVVAIIAVLVAIAIPVFTTQLERSREATDIANVRSAYAGAVTQYLQNGSADPAVSVSAVQTVEGWQTGDGSNPKIGTDISGFADAIELSPSTKGWTVGVNIASGDDQGTVYISTNS